MKVLIAFDKFKDSMSAQTACAVAAQAVRAKYPNARIVEAPLTDGGEGFCDILTRSYGGELSRHKVKGPHFQEVDALLGYVPLESLPGEIRTFLSVPELGRLAIVEMAQASGLESVPRDKRDPWVASTFGTGELLRIAATEGASAILLGIGGSATNDLGLGALQALGMRFIDSNGSDLSDLTPSLWEQVVRLDGDACDLPCVRIACDVSNSLLGPNGAARVYGPQKGLRPDDMVRMELGMEHMAKLLCDYCGESESVMKEPSSGAAGGIGFGLRVACSARYVPGFELVWNWLGLNHLLRSCDVLVTGEGRFDSSSFQGKGPGMLVRSAADLGKRALIFAGRIDDRQMTAQSELSLLDMIEISPRELPLEQALKLGPELLKEAVTSSL